MPDHQNASPGPHRSFYVRRVRLSDDKLGYTGSIRSRKQAEREADAWRESGWSADVLPNTREVRADVRSWSQAVAESRLYGTPVPPASAFARA